MFPLGDLPKSEVRKIAAELKLPSAERHDSQGICFLGKINYNDYIREYVGEKEGDIIEIETGKVLGKHKGFWFHTIGQRKGLGLGGGPWFVVKKDTQNNIVFVSMGSHIVNYDSMIVLTHFKGHAMGGFGGSMKNLAIGCADGRMTGCGCTANFTPPNPMHRCR